MIKKEWQISFRLVIITPYLCFRKDETVRRLSSFKLSDRIFSDFKRRFVEGLSAFEFFQVLQAGRLKLSFKILSSFPRSTYKQSDITGIAKTNVCTVSGKLKKNI
jgi:hypothetical protein